MKNLFNLLVLITISESAFAHPGSHEHYDVVGFIHHFFTEPDHLLIMAVVSVVLVLARSRLYDYLNHLMQKTRFK